MKVKKKMKTKKKMKIKKIKIVKSIKIEILEEMSIILIIIITNKIITKNYCGIIFLEPIKEYLRRININLTI